MTDNHISPLEEAAEMAVFDYWSTKGSITSTPLKDLFIKGAEWQKTNESTPTPKESLTVPKEQLDEVLEALDRILKCDLYDDDDYNHDSHFAGQTSELQSAINNAKSILEKYKT